MLLTPMSSVSSSYPTLIQKSNRHNSVALAFPPVLTFETLVYWLQNFHIILPYSVFFSGLTGLDQALNDTPCYLINPQNENIMFNFRMFQQSIFFSTHYFHVLQVYKVALYTCHIITIVAVRSTAKVVILYVIFHLMFA